VPYPKSSNGCLISVTRRMNKITQFLEKEAKIVEKPKLHQSSNLKSQKTYIKAP
jgi:hypothetical protein